MGLDKNSTGEWMSNDRKLNFFPPLLEEAAETVCAVPTPGGFSRSDYTNQINP